MPVALVDISDLHTISPETVIEAIADSFHAQSHTDEADLGSIPSPSVIALDACELLGVTDKWLWTVLLRHLPANCRTLLASRRPPRPVTEGDTDWVSWMNVVRLAPLTPSQCLHMLEPFALSPSLLEASVAFARGNPWALLAAAQTGGEGFTPNEPLERAPPALATRLLRRVLRGPDAVRNAGEETALHICALARLTDQDLLEELADSPQDTTLLFDWLRDLSFVRVTRDGLKPSELIRSLVASELGYRSPRRRARILSALKQRSLLALGNAHAVGATRVIADLAFLGRNHSGVGAYLRVASDCTLSVGPLHKCDVTPLTRLVRRHRGRHCARVVSVSFQEHPSFVKVLRDPSGQPLGLLLATVLEASSCASDHASDPVFYWVQTVLSRDILPAASAASARILLFREWLTEDEGQKPCQAIVPLLLEMLRQARASEPHMAAYALVDDYQPWSGFACFAHVATRPVSATALPNANAEASSHLDRTQHLVKVCWRPLSAALETIEETATDTVDTDHHRSFDLPESAQLAPLTRSEFAAAVQEALRVMATPEGLYGSPLLRCRFVTRDAPKNASEEALVDALRHALVEAAVGLKSTPRGARLCDALHHRYFSPAPTLHRAAELLHISDSTLCRQLRHGEQLLTSMLWRVEQGLHGLLESSPCVPL